MTRLEELVRRQRELERELADVEARIDAELDRPKPRVTQRRRMPDVEVTDIAIAAARRLAAKKGIRLP